MSQATLRDFVRERQALGALLAAGVFLPSSNSARLLSFLCERYFEDPGQELTEYDIAVGALGRRSDFDSRRDSVVRVEIHRLRKRLKDYYTTQGASERVQIVLPPGQYAPQFLTVEEADIPEQAPPPEAIGRRRSWIRPVVAALLSIGVVLLGTVWLVLGRKANPKPTVPVSAMPASGPQSEVRLLAGYPSGKYIDQYGHLWAGDAYFQGGTAADVRYGRLALTGDPTIYQHARQGFEFSYDIPLKPGVYEMRLHFAEPSLRVPMLGETGESLRQFRVTANEKQLLPPRDARHVFYFDIFSDTGGEDLADVKVFKDIAPAADGKLHLKFHSSKQEAMVNAIEITPGEPGRMRPIRLCAASRSMLDNRGNVWLPDNFAQGGRLSVFNRPISGTDVPALFQGERFGHFTYTIPVAPGRYTVSLGFVENYHTVWDRAPAKGTRLFNVYLNGVLRLKDFDVAAMAGGALQAVTRAFRDVEPTPQDKIAIAFEPVTEAAIVNTVEVTDQGDSRR